MFIFVLLNNISLMVYLGEVVGHDSLSSAGLLDGVVQTVTIMECLLSVVLRCCTVGGESCWERHCVC